jgi:hypothetical protein
MKRDQIDHIPPEVLRQLAAGVLRVAETHLVLHHLLACGGCLAAYHALLAGERLSPASAGEFLLGGWGRADHLDFETLRTQVDLWIKEGRRDRTTPPAYESSGGADGWAVEHLAGCRLCQWAVADLATFALEQREIIGDQAPKGLPAQPRGRVTMAIHLRIGKRGRAEGSRRFLLPLGVGLLLQLGSIGLA